MNEMPFILMGAGVLLLLAWQYGKAWRQAVGPTHNPTELFSTDLDDPFIDQQQRAEMDWFINILQNEGFTFAYYAETQYPLLKLTYTHPCFLNADRTIMAEVIGRIGMMPPAIELISNFADGGKMHTLSPWGEPVDTPMFHSRHAYDADEAIIYHRKQMHVMTAKHGAVVPYDSFEDYRKSVDTYTARDREHFHKRLGIAIRNHMLRCLAALVIVLGMATLVWATSSMRGGSPFQLAALLISVSVTMGVLGLNQWLDKRRFRFVGAIDEGINPPPYIGEPQQKKKKGWF